mgnify:CR=1 FL=1
MTAYEKFQKVREHIGDESLFEHIVNWLPDDELEEMMDDAISDNDLDYFFPEEF